MLLASIQFPNLDIVIENLPKGVHIFGFEIRYYAILIALGLYLGLHFTEKEAARTGQNPELYLDYLFYAFIPTVLGARLYYVMFNWGEFRDDLLQIFDIRDGGVAIYGGVIAGTLVLIYFTKKKNLSFFMMADTASIGLVIGQILGRWGNFINREAFGGYTDNLFAMQIRLSEAAHTTQELMDKIQIVGGEKYIQVHPTFLYESLWNVGVLIVILWFRRKKKYDGQIFFMYLAGYALGRIWIEQLRTDQLLLPGTNLPVSQCLAVLIAIASVGTMIYISKNNNKPLPLKKTRHDEMKGE